MKEMNCILTRDVAQKKMERMALEIREQLSDDGEPLVLIGIKENGFIIAQIMFDLLAPANHREIKIIACTLNKKQPAAVEFSEDISYDNKNIILVDDVANSGRTLLYALKPLLEFYPRRIQTLCLVERMHKAFPIKPDYVGLSVATTLQDHIQVEVEDGKVTGAYLL